MTRSLAAGALALGAVITGAAPADAAKQVPNNITTVSAFAYNNGYGDKMEVTALYDTALKGSPSKAAATMTYVVTWKDGPGTTVGTEGSTQGLYPKSTDWYVAVTRPAGAVEVRVTGTLTLLRGSTVVDTFDTGAQACAGTWTSYPVTLFSVQDTD